MRLAVVFSGGVGALTKDLEMRLRTALYLFNGLKAVDMILCVGGQYRRTWNGKDSTARGMRQWLIEQGDIPRDKVSALASSVTTIGNIREDVLIFLRTYQPKSVYFVSFRQHLKRIRRTVEEFVSPTSVELRYYPTSWQPGALGRAKEFLLYCWTIADPKGEGRVWQYIALRQRKKRLAELAKLAKLEGVR